MISSLSSEYLDYDKEKRAKLAGKVQQIRWGAALEFRSAQFEMLLTHSEMPRRILERRGCGSGDKDRGPSLSYNARRWHYTN